MPREITAYSNPLIKWARDLRDKRHRKQSRQFLAEGLRILTEARDTGPSSASSRAGQADSRKATQRA